MTNEHSVSNKSWYKKWWAIALFIFIGLGILGSLGKDAAKTSPTDQRQVPETSQNASQTSKSYQQIFTFSGTGAKKSEPFKVSGDRFKIKYDCTGDLCQAFMYKVGSNLPSVIMNGMGPLKDETISYGSGEYYIDVNSIGKYSMIIEDYK